MDMFSPDKAERRDARLDHAVLLAALAARRATSEAAKAANGPAAAPASDEPITEILLAGPGWRRAKSDQQGCFNRSAAEGRP